LQWRYKMVTLNDATYAEGFEVSALAATLRAVQLVVFGHLFQAIVGAKVEVKEILRGGEFSQLELLELRSQVLLHVFVQVGFLGEFLVAVDGVTKGARKGLLLGVDPGMVVKVVPFSKLQFAAVEVTLDQFQVPVSLWVSELEDAELTSRWH